MVFYSIKSSEKVFHMPNCSFLSRMKKENTRQFESPEEARAHGYRICNCCCRVGTQVRKERGAIQRFCQEKEVSCCLEDGQIHVRTPYSEWCIVDGNKSRKLILYHRNCFEKLDEEPSAIPGYHVQIVRKDTDRSSIMAHLQYIVEHDVFSIHREEARQKKKRALHNLRQNTWKYMRGKTTARFSANQLYSILEDACI